MSCCQRSYPLHSTEAPRPIRDPESPKTTRLWRAYARRWVRYSERWEATYHAALGRQLAAAWRRFNRASKREARR